MVIPGETSAFSSNWVIKLHYWGLHKAFLGYTRPFYNVTIPWVILLDNDELKSAGTLLFLTIVLDFFFSSICPKLMDINTLMLHIVAVLLPSCLIHSKSMKFLFRQTEMNVKIPEFDFIIRRKKISSIFHRYAEGSIIK